MTVIEGEDPAVHPLKPLYREAGVPLVLCDLGEVFGAARVERRRLPFPDNAFDVITCWETMEHFNFNPVGFVRDLKRLLKPGGRVLVTAPNVANLANRVRLLCGRPIGMAMTHYREFYGYNEGRFLGFHWREYTLAELERLFQLEGFEIRSARHMLTFENRAALSAARRLKRMAAKVAFALLPSSASTCSLVAEKCPATDPSARPHPRHSA